jgi:hypothetical protein
MKRFWIGMAVTLFLVVPANAQEKAANQTSQVVPNVAVSSGQVTPTPEMWFYEQRLREYLNPKMSIRRVVEQDAAQARARMAARKWFGYSNSRPVASPDPYYGTYSPGWAGNNSLYPYRWNGYGSAWVLRPIYYGNPHY